MTNVPCMSEEKLRKLVFEYFMMVSLEVLTITECRAPNQNQSLILCCTNKELDYLLDFQFVGRTHIWYGENSNTESKPSTGSQPVFQTATTNIKDMSTWIYFNN